MMMMKIILCVVNLICLAQCYPTGPPTSVCSSMTPNHGVTAQSSAAPYTITASASSYNASDELTITITPSSGTTLRGFLVEAREGSSSSASHGSFTAGTDQGTLDCFSSTANAISHTSNVDKSTASFTWTPGSSTADITFTATIVQVKLTYWTGVVSTVVTHSAGVSVIPSVTVLLCSLMLVFKNSL